MLLKPAHRLSEAAQTVQKDNTRARVELYLFPGVHVQWIVDRLCLSLSRLSIISRIQKAVQRKSVLWLNECISYDFFEQPVAETPGSFAQPAGCVDVNFRPAL